MCRIIVLCAVLLLIGLPTTLTGQPVPAWTAIYDTGNNSAYAQKVQVDSDGNVYVAGESTVNYTSVVAVVKYSADGAQLWSHEQPSPQIGNVSALVVSQSREVYVVTTLYTGGIDIFITKYHENGAFQWQRQFDSGTADIAQAAAVDTAGNIYVAGSIGPDSSSDYLLLKYTSNGVLSWARTHSEAEQNRESARNLALDSSGNIYIAGDSHQPSGGQYAATTIKFDAMGSIIWVRQFLTGNYSEGVTRGLAVDAAGNVHVGTTATNGMGAIKYDAAGTLLWGVRYQGSGAGLFIDLAVDASQNVYIAGTSPGSSMDPVTGGSSTDVVTVKINSSGAIQWISRYNGMGNPTDQITGMGVDSLGQVVVAGTTYGFGSQLDMLTFQIDARGNQQWVALYDNAGEFDDLQDMALGGSAVHLVGTSPSTNGVPRFLTIKYVPTVPAGQPRITVPPQDAETVAGRSNITFTVTAEGPGPLSYQWRFFGRDILGATGATYTIPNADVREAGEYSVRVSNSAGTTVSPEARLLVGRPAVLYYYPSDQTVVEGRTVMWSVYADGDRPLYYQWYFNDSPLPDETNQTLRLFTVTTNATGNYTLEVTNTYGRATTPIARLTVAPRSPVDRWTWRSPIPQGNELTDIAYGNGRFVAVGEEGTVIVSTNGIDWSVHATDIDDLYGVAFGEGLFVAIGLHGVFTSPDGIAWTPRRLPKEYNLRIGAIAYGAGRFVAVGDGIVSSDDGVTWVDAGESLWGSGVAYGNAMFVVIRNADSLVSSNGLDWTVRSGVGGPYYLTFGNGLFVGHTFNAVYVSSNALNWQLVFNLTNHYLNAIDFADDRFVAVGSKLLTSTDGYNWTQQVEFADFSTQFTAAAGAGGQMIAVGDDGVIYRSTGGAWTQIGGGTPNNLRGIIYANNRFTIVGNDGVIWYSADGANFSRTVGPNTNNLRAIAYGNDTYVIAGSGGALLTSRDGFNWASHSVVTNDLYGLVFVNGHFIAAGEQGRIIVSTNARDWTLTFGNTGERLQGIAYGAGRYVATGRRGHFAISSNAVTWQGLLNSPLGYLEAVTYVNGSFVAVGANGRIFVSADGISWASMPTPSGRELESVIYAENQFIAAGDNGTIMTSSNAFDWLEHRALTRNSFRQIIYARGALWAVGNNDMVMRSGQLRPWLTVGPVTATAASIGVRAEPGQNILLEASNDSQNWEPLTSQPASADGTVSYQDAPRPPRRFYRALSP